MSHIDAKVKLPKEFFAKSKLEYTDWRFAFFREIIQNCFDAGSNQIDFKVNQDAEYVIVSVSDDGCGMSSDTLQNVLLCMGGSLKQEGAIGGFGYAKSLLFFSHDSYDIYTRFSTVHGSGGDYTLHENLDFTPGTRINVRMSGEDAETLRLVLRSYVKHLRTARPLRITLDDEVLPAMFDDFEFKFETELGTMLFKDIPGQASTLVVSVAGLPMFKHNVWSSGVDAFSGTIDLRGNTFDMLTANRDSLKGTFGDKLSRIVRGLIEERFSYKFGQSIDMTLNWTTPQWTSGGGRIALEADPSGFRFMENGIFPHNWNIRVENTVGRASAKLASSTTSVSSVVSLLKKGWVQRLAVSWKYLMLQLLKTEYLAAQGVVRGASTLVEEYYFNGKRIAAGFILADKLEGINIITKDTNEIYIMCNPRYLDKSFTMPDLCDLAIHECTHLLASGHNDLFNDAEMKLRRSLRKLVSESELDVHAKAVVRQWRDSSIQI